MRIVEIERVDHGHVVYQATDIGRAAIDDAIAFVRNHARPWIDSGQAKASDDPYTIARIGALEIQHEAADALLDRAGWTLRRPHATKTT